MRKSLHVIMYLSAIVSCLLLALFGYLFYLRTPDANQHARFSAQKTTSTLIWLGSHQSRDGSWRVHTWDFQCQDKSDFSEYTLYSSDLCYTSLAVLCFLGTGYDHKAPSKFKKIVARSLQWLLDNQDEDGAWSDQTVEQAMAAMVLCEAYAMTLDPVIKEPAQKGIAFLSTHQKRCFYDRLEVHGWGTTLADTDFLLDFKASYWGTLALNAAKSAGYDAGHSWSLLRDGWLNLASQELGVIDERHISFMCTALILTGSRSGDYLLDRHVDGELFQCLTDPVSVSPDRQYAYALSFLHCDDSVWDKYSERRPVLLKLFGGQKGCQLGSVSPELIPHSNRFEATVFLYLTTVIYYHRRPRVSGRKP